METQTAAKTPRTSYVCSRRFVSEYETVCQALGSIGEMREPEIVAATGLTVAQIFRVCREAVKLGWLNRRAEDGEISINTSL